MYAIRVNENDKVNQVSSRTQPVHSDSNLIDFFIGDNTMKCIICGNQIPEENWWRNPKYCCWKCYQVAHKAKKEKRICLFCKRKFIVQKCLKKNYCSKKCRHKSQINIGHRYIGRNGYWYIKTGPKKYELEHRLIAESKLGRKLNSKEHTHHINGIKTDNRPENIEVFESNSAHTLYHNSLYKGRHPKDSLESIAKRVHTRLAKRPIKCETKGCQNRRIGRGLCSQHYYQCKKNGILLKFKLEVDL